jgi:hypothetical protein
MILLHGCGVGRSACRNSNARIEVLIVHFASDSGEQEECAYYQDVFLLN